MSKPHFVDITPDKSLIKKLGLTGYRTEQAIAELVDNSIDARIPNKTEEISIKLDFNNKTISIIDDGTGMNKEEIINGMTIARGTKGPGNLGQFGIGMKSACAALGKRFQIVTRRIDERTEFIVDYDEDEWLTNPDKSWTHFEINERDPTSDWHGTKIEISNLNVPLYPNQVSNFKNNYGIRYGPYLRNGEIRLKINTILIPPQEPEIEEGTKRSIEIVTLTGARMKGWVGLLKKRSIRGNFGIHLFKYGRLIKAYDKFGIPEHPEFAKIIGQLDLDHVPVNYHKREFIVDSLEYREAEATFQNDPVVKKMLREATKPMAKSSSVESVIQYLSGNKKSVGYIDTRIRADVAKQVLTEAASRPLITHKGKVRIEFDSKKDTLYDAKKVGETTVITIHTNNDAFRYVKNPLFLIGWIGAEAELIAENMSFYTDFIDQRNLNWSTFLNDWGKREQMYSKDQMQTMIHNYDLMDDLVSINDLLKERYENKYQFTSLSTLAKFTHYSLGKIVFTIQTPLRAGQYLTDLLMEIIKQLETAGILETNSYAVIYDPKASELATVMNVAPQTRFLVVRESHDFIGYEKAGPAKAWIDLVVDVYEYGIPMPDVELRYILAELINQKMVDKEKIKAMADRSPLKGKVDSILKEV